MAKSAKLPFKRGAITKQDIEAAFDVIRAKVRDEWDQLYEAAGRPVGKSGLRSSWDDKFPSVPEVVDWCIRQLKLEIAADIEANRKLGIDATIQQAVDAGVHGLTCEILGRHILTLSLGEKMDGY